MRSPSFSLRDCLGPSPPSPGHAAARVLREPGHVAAAEGWQLRGGRGRGAGQEPGRRPSASAAREALHPSQSLGPIVRAS